ncbi:SGNH/GDSL hydrolase family protein [Sphingomonas sp. RS2018]
MIAANAVRCAARGAIVLSVIGLPLAGLSTPAAAQHWSRSWAAAPQAPLSPQANRPVPDLRDRTVRQVVRLSNGGSALRVRITNEMSDAVLRIGQITVAKADSDGRIAPNSARVLRFSGLKTVLGHAALVSDAVAMPVQAGERVTISIHLPDGATAPTVHSHAAATAWIAPGDQTGSATLTDAVRFNQRLMIAAVDVETRRPAHTIVTYGDSITDGARATNDADTRYPDQLADRLRRAGRKNVAVANMGIGGNRLLIDGTGPSGLARFDRDVLAVPGVSHVIVLEGVNDIGTATRDRKRLPSPEELIGAYRQMIARGRAAGVKVILATILPYKGAGYWSEEGEAVRTAINRWIMTAGEADGAVDFARTVARPDDPQRIAPAFDGGDALHPNDAGFQAMAAAIDLRLLR